MQIHMHKHIHMHIHIHRLAISAYIQMHKCIHIVEILRDDFVSSHQTLK